MTQSASHLQNRINSPGQVWLQFPDLALAVRRSFCLFLTTCMLWGAFPLSMKAQVNQFKVTDRVELPLELGGDSGSTLYLEFTEYWTFFPDKPSIQKESGIYQVRNAGEETLPASELQQQFAGRIGQLPVTRDKVILREITYEFNLLEPHFGDSGPEGFQEPDSMDQVSRELQEAFIHLVRGHTGNIDRYHLREQLLSLHFHETWHIDPATLKISRQVEAITPVIWQRRRTTEGEPIDEFGTGYPVYYKNSLETISLRNP